MSENGALLVSDNDIHIGFVITLKIDCFFALAVGPHTLNEQAK